MSEYFAYTFAEARSKFVAAVAKAGGVLESRKIGDIKGAEGEDLTIDFGVFRNGDVVEKALIVTTGIHGVEGYAGSAALISDCEILASTPLPENTMVVFVHAINPYGMSWHRRWNEDNIDLNRNFLEPEDFQRLKSEDPPKLYTKFYDFVNPSQPVSKNEWFRLKVALLILRFRKSSLKQAVALGQYAHPKGIFFGGHKRAVSHEIVLEVLTSLGISRESKTLKRVIHNDIHTGVGSFGVDSCLVTTEKDLEETVALLGGRKGKGWTTENIGNNDAAVAGEGYQVSGAIMEGLRTALCPSSCHWSTFTDEFGTRSSLFSVRCLRAENAAYQQDQRLPLDSWEKKQCYLAFCPDDDKWKEGVVSRTREVFHRVGREMGFALEVSSQS